MVDCKEAMHRVYRYLDRELTADERAIVQRHLDGCPPCADLFRFEENVLTFVGRRCRQTEAPEQLRDRVRRLCQAPPSSD
jgi:mycothiol system anti-sigma-R factor